MSKEKSSSTNNNTNRYSKVLTTLAMTIISVVLLLSIFTEKFVLRCLIKSIIGYDCPFCGAQRALYHLMHGNFENAFLVNPFIFIIFPYAVLVILCIFNVFPEGSTLRRITYNKFTIIATGAFTITWGILRNTDFIKNILTFAGI